MLFILALTRHRAGITLLVMSVFLFRCKNSALLRLQILRQESHPEGSQVSPTHCGDMPVVMRTVTGNTVCILFSDVLYAEKFDNLLSIGQLRAEPAAALKPTLNWKGNEGKPSFSFSWNE